MALEFRQVEFDLTIHTPWTHQSWIQSIWSVGRHQHLDITSWIKPIQLRDDLKHRTLDFIVRPSFLAGRTASTDRINFIKENNARFLRTRHGKQFTNHSRTFTNVLL